MNDNSLATFIGSLIAAPFVAVADWFRFLNRLPLGRQELAKACHAAGILALLLYAFAVTSGLDEFFTAWALHRGDPVYWIPAMIAAAAGIWFLLYARFAARAVVRPQRGVMIVRALVKIALGWAVWAYAMHADLSGFEIALRAAAVWCVVTGAIQFLLMLCGGRSNALPRIVAHIEQRTGQMRPAQRRSF